jgi:putative tricarboxylic transport membrane protein
MSDASDAAGGIEVGARRNASAVALALAIMALGAFVVFDTATDLTGPGYAQVGPGVFPVIVGAALLLAGLTLLAQSLRGYWRVAWVERDLSSAHSLNSGNPLRNVLLVAAALTLNVMLFAPLGFIAASAVLFACVSAAFGSRRFVLDAALGIASAAAIYVVFVYGLGLHLPAGELWEGMPWRR